MTSEESTPSRSRTRITWAVRDRPRVVGDVLSAITPAPIVTDRSPTERVHQREAAGVARQREVAAHVAAHERRSGVLGLPDQPGEFLVSDTSVRHGRGSVIGYGAIPFDAPERFDRGAGRVSQSRARSASCWDRGALAVSDVAMTVHPGLGARRDEQHLVEALVGAVDDGVIGGCARKNLRRVPA
jgi:hypothetical protein